MFSVLKTYTLESIVRFFKKNRIAKIITILGFLAAFAFLVTVVYFGARQGFRYIAKDMFFGDALFVYIIELFLLVTSILVSASALISGLFVLFEGKDNIPLMASPRYYLRPWFVFLRMCASSLWPLIAMTLPVLFAINSVYGLSFVGFVLTLLSVTLVVLFSIIGALLTLLFVAWILYFFGRKNNVLVTRRNFILLVTGIFLTKMFIIWQKVTTINLVKFFQARILDIDIPDLSPLLEQFNFLPTHFAALTLYLARTGIYDRALQSLFAQNILCAGALVVLFLLARHHILLWQVFQEHLGENTGRGGHLGQGAILGATDGNDALRGKELIAFTRNARGILWLGFIVLIWFLQTGATKILARGLGSERVTGEAIPAFVGTFQFAVIMYFISMCVLRFAFPSFSTERKTAWIIGSAPINLSVIFRSKQRFFVALFSSLAILFALLNSHLSGLSVFFTAILILAIIIATLFLTTLGLTLGAYFPNYESDDPEILSTTLPGIGFILVSLSYGALGAFFLSQYFKKGIGIGLIAFLFFSVAMIVFMTRKTEVRLGRALL